jgi:hypothetical protein
MEDENNFMKIMPLKTNKSNIKTNPCMDCHIIPKHPSSVLFCGKSGSGKTNLVLNLLTKKEFLKNYFDMIFLFSQTAKSGCDDLYTENLPELEEDHIFEPDYEGLEQLDHILETQKKIIKDKGIDKSPKILILFDDIAHSRAFLASKQYLQLHIMNRHYNISTFSLTQSYTKIPRAARCQVSAVAFFHGACGTEIERISEEHTPKGWKEKQFKVMVEYAIKKKYDFLFINKHAASSEQYRQNLDVILKLSE